MTTPSLATVSTGVRAAALVIVSLPVGFAIAAAGRRFAGASQISSQAVAAASGAVALGAFVFWSSAAAPLSALWIDLGLGWTLLGLAAIDMAALRLPDLLTVPLALAGLVTAGPLSPPLPDRLAGIAFGVGAIAALDMIYVRLRGRNGIGHGDAKLFGAAGAWLGWRALPSVLLFACAMGLAWVAVRLLVRGRAAAANPIPFGASLCAALLLLWLLGS